MQRLAKVSLVVALAVMATATGAAQNDWKPRLGVQVNGGILVDGVDEGSVAKSGGLRSGDVIVRCGDLEITGFESVRSWLATAKAGQKVPVSVMRGTESMDLELSFAATGAPRLGIGVVEGILVTGVTPGSTAAGAGIQTGDFITRLGDSDITGFDSLKDAIAAVKAGSSHEIVVARGGGEVIAHASWGGAAGPAAPSRPAPAIAGPADSAGPARGQRPGGLFGALPMGGGVEAMMGAPAIRDDVNDVLLSLERLQDPRLEGAIKKLRGVRDRMQSMADAVEGMKRMAEQFMGGLGDLGDMDVPDLGGLGERLEELMGGDLSIEKIRKIIGEEFPGVQVEVHEEHEHETPVKPESKPATQPSGKGKKK